jgi:hypothetical protein
MRANSFRNYQDPQYKAWRKAVYARDKRKCMWPKCCSRKKLQAHHIRRWADYPSLRYEVDNGITLCKSHHDMIKNQEDYYAYFFLTILQHNVLKSRKRKKKDG